MCLGLNNLLNKIQSPYTDFMSVYMEAENIKENIYLNKILLNFNELEILKNIFLDKKFLKEKNSLRLYIAISEIFKSQLIYSSKKLFNEVTNAIISLLKNLAPVQKHALSRVLASIVFEKSKFEYRDIIIETKQIPLNNVLNQNLKNGKWYGRSYVVLEDNSLIVIKFLKPDEEENSLKKEISNIINLKSFKLIKNKVPYLYEKTPYIYSCDELEIDNQPILHKPYKYIIFRAQKSYFSYLTDSKMKFHDFNYNMSQCIEQLAYLSSKGFIHNAVVPLFHNSTQAYRRKDLGKYIWYKGGRLDKWLDASKYPNIGYSGIRDFEHFDKINFSRDIYAHMGSHFLSFILISGRYFRMKNPELSGTIDSKPADATKLFSKKKIKTLLKTIINSYYIGYTGDLLKNGFDFDIDSLSDDIIEEMGNDKYMEEIIRPYDEVIHKDIKSNSLISGPHLGAYNKKFSIPKLLEFIDHFLITLFLKKIENLKKEESNGLFKGV